MIRRCSCARVAHFLRALPRNQTLFVIVRRHMAQFISLL